MEQMNGQGVENAVAIVALALSLLSFGFSYFLDRQTRKREERIEGRDDRIEKSTAYLQLEVHSSEAFRFAAANCEAMRFYQSSQRPSLPRGRDSHNAEITRQYYYQCLNLFEVCSNFRRNGVIADQVYASWIAWFHEILDQWYFREIWAAEMRDNYTHDVRNIFDLGTCIYATRADPEVRRREFYSGISHLLGGCDVIERWLDELALTPEWPPKEHGTVVMKGLQEA